MKKVLGVILLLLNLHDAWSQVEASLQSSLEVPLDELKWIYKPGLNTLLSISQYDEYKKVRTVWGGNLGFALFKPKKDVFYYLAEKNEVGTVVYDKCYIAQLSAHGRRDFIINEKFEIFVGGEIGYLYTKYSFRLQDLYADDNETILENRIFLVPKVGFNFPFSETVSMFIQSRYMVSVGKTNIETNFWNYSVSAGAGVHFRL